MGYKGGDLLLTGVAGQRSGRCPDLCVQAVGSGLGGPGSSQWRERIRGGLTAGLRRTWQCTIQIDGLYLYLLPYDDQGCSADISRQWLRGLSSAHLSHTSQDPADTARHQMPMLYSPPTAIPLAPNTTKSKTLCTHKLHWAVPPTPTLMAVPTGCGAEVFTFRMPVLSLNQQRWSTEG